MTLFHGSNIEVSAPRLLPQRLKDQYAFKTDVALSCLEYREVRKV